MCGHTRMAEHWCPVFLHQTISATPSLSLTAPFQLLHSARASVVEHHVEAQDVGLHAPGPHQGWKGRRRGQLLKAAHQVPALARGYDQQACDNKRPNEDLYFQLEIV